MITVKRLGLEGKTLHHSKRTITAITDT